MSGDPAADADDNEPESRLSRIQAIASDASGRWQERYRAIDNADLLCDEEGLPG